jgi:UDP-galactopyranose mutase
MDILCFSHLRWDFVYQRPQHLMTRLARHNRVFYIQEPIFDAPSDRIDIDGSIENICIIQLFLEQRENTAGIAEKQYALLQLFFSRYQVTNYICWYYTPMALPVGSLFQPKLVIYDCMDELSAFKFAPPHLKQMEQTLLAAANLVFTGGYSLYEAKKEQHPYIYPFPSSIDKTHFNKARSMDREPEDQAAIPFPRLGFYGVLDERFDIDLIRFIATNKPGWQLVIIGPVAKIDPATLPRLSNIHYLGTRSYNDLPAYLSGWDLAMISFALNESTRFISPTKTPEYLAAGKPVISTAIEDVINPYGNIGLVHIAHSPEAFIEKAEHELTITDKQPWLTKVDAFLADLSWDETVNSMLALIQEALTRKQAVVTPKEEKGQYV